MTSIIFEKEVRDSFMVLVEGLDLRAEYIGTEQLIAAWRMLSRNPLPRVKALRLSDADFDHILTHKRCPGDELREIIEWGRILSTKGTDACIFNAEGTEESGYIILVRQNPYHTIDEILVHELAHIVKGDL